MEKGGLNVKRIAVLGCGLVGSTIVRQLASDRELVVTAVDASDERLASLGNMDSVILRKADLSQAGSITKLAKDFDVLVGALPGWMGFRALEEVIEAGKNYCDISFMPEDAEKLDHLAKQKGVSVVVDCGVAPGLANLMVGKSHLELERTDSVLIMVGGLPRERILPWEYKAPFSPSDVIEEYTRPARQIREGKMVVLPPLSEVELVDVPKVGTLESFNTDGLRSLLTSIRCSEMREKTLRYPGHAAKVKLLSDSGFFSQETIQAGGVKIRPLDLSSRLLFDQWSLGNAEAEFTYMKVEVKGQGDRGYVCHAYELFDETDLETGTSSMARTTGFPCAFIAKRIALGDLARPGVSAPESLVHDSVLFNELIGFLRSKGIAIEHDIRPVDEP